MHRTPSRPVRPCFVRICSAAVQEHDLRGHDAMPSEPFLRLHTFAHLAMLTSHSHIALDTSFHLKPRELLSPHLSSSHVTPSLFTCHISQFFSIVFISMYHRLTFFISSKFFSTHLSCSAFLLSAHRSLRHRRIVTSHRKSL